nr:hypothetical protein [Entomoplasma sp. MP1]
MWRKMKWLFTDFMVLLRNSKDNENRITKEDLEYVKITTKGQNNYFNRSSFEHISEHIKTNYEDFLPDYYLTNAGAAVYDNKGNELMLSI